ncbi:MAG TPA: type I secretion C-terminal target domain-containing protein [Leptolyngbyaceae cyanobacterium]
MAISSITSVAPDTEQAIQNLSYNNATTTSELTFNQSVSGTIDEQGEKNVFTFTGTAGQLLYYDALQNNLSDNIRVRLVDPLGNTIFLNEDADNDYPLYPSEFDQASLLTLTESGTYQLILESNASDNFESGSYQFRLIDVANAPTLSVNEVITLPSGGAAGLYRVTGITEAVRFETVGEGVASIRGRVYSQNGQFSSPLFADVSFPFTISEGSILVVDVSGVQDSSYSFQLEPFVTPIELNTPISGTYRPGDIFLYSFTGIAGQRLYYDALIEDNFSNASVSIVGKDGYIYLYGNVDSDVLFTYPFPETGTYTLVVQDTSGAYENPPTEFSFQLLDAGANTLSLNTVVSGTVPAGQQTQLYTFKAQPLQKLFFNSLTAAPSSANWILYGDNPFIPVARGGNISSDFVADLLPYDIDYVLEIDGFGSTETNFSFQVTSINLTDIINGSSERDTLIGSDANNLIIGSQGADVLTGGLGRDIFQYTSLVDGGDRITDFTVGSDQFELGQLLENLGYQGTDPIGEGYVQFRSRGRNGSSVNIDPDGFAGSAKARNFIVVENVDVASLSNPENFIFISSASY